MAWSPVPALGAWQASKGTGDLAWSPAPCPHQPSAVCGPLSSLESRRPSCTVSWWLPEAPFGPLFPHVTLPLFQFTVK